MVPIDIAGMKKKQLVEQFVCSAQNFKFLSCKTAGLDKHDWLHLHCDLHCDTQVNIR